MNKKRYAMFMISGINVMIGIILAAQFQTFYSPDHQQSRDTIQLRRDLQKEMERHQQLLADISRYELLLYQYETTANEQDTLSIMKEELEQIKSFAGYAPVRGEGLVIRIVEDEYNNGFVDGIPVMIIDEDLMTLANELFYNGARAMSINGHRLTAMTSIRNVGQQIQVNSYPIQFPYEIKVIGDPQALMSAIQIAGLHDYFRVVNKKLTMEQRETIIIPAFREVQSVRFLQPVTNEKVSSS